MEGLEKNILFDTGGNSSILLSNMEKLGVSPESIHVIVLSHVHGDHIGGLTALLERNRSVRVIARAMRHARCFQKLMESSSSRVASGSLLTSSPPNEEELDMASVLYGPVPSRRLGRSLGVDIVPFKTCTYDCIYCQLGRTTEKTVRRASFAPVGDVVRELDDVLKRVSRPDYVTVSGSGEPTLCSDLEELVARIKEITDVPVAILTNGSLFFHKEVREACRQADLIVPSLDAGDELLFRYVNRPHESLSFNEVVEGLVELRNEFDKEIWLEVFLLGGVTATPAEVLKIKEHVNRIRPNKTQLNTVVRPPSEEFAFPVGQKDLANLCKLFGEGAEVIVPFTGDHRTHEFNVRRDDVLALIARRPCSIDDVSSGLTMNRSEVLKYLNDLVSDGLVTYAYQNGELYYQKG